MPIHQALFAQSSGLSYTGSWGVVDTHRYQGDGTTFTLNGLQENDLIIVYAGSDARNLSSTTITGHTYHARGRVRSIGYFISYKIQPSGSTSSTFTFNFSGELPDYAVAIAMRPPFSISGYTFDSKYATTSGNTNSTPTHKNQNVSFSSNELALLSAWQDDDNAAPMNPPSNSTDIVEDVESGDGSIGVAFKSIETGGTYSWGSWTTTGNDRWITDILGVTPVS
jgi:hypothetical protein